MPSGTKSGSRIVYSTGVGSMCPGCVRPVRECVCGRVAQQQLQGPVRVARETKGRGGKAVTVITGLALAPDALLELAKVLKQRCGSGGTVRDGVLEIQGEHRETILAELLKRGFDAKGAGGLPGKGR